MAAFSLATGSRRSNVTGLTWSKINFKRKLARFEADVMKAGNPQIVPLNQDAMRILLTRKNIHPGNLTKHPLNYDVKI
ncbi:integrase [Herbaspirillum sp. Sphag1AN]|nr:integrase [Herbaspirillum sp. Sphag1AN]MBB3245885.1 integrase [Herbaspirillum sp. Sphag64]